ncbi:sigma-70 family RNA polymerase sigma factor [Geminicoccaceae bacterium 1502E]|nr:sigma-70 family RNA polymerase sigma factor [Geminicoccaceae bacterium 1502E]
MRPTDASRLDREAEPEADEALEVATAAEAADAETRGTVPHPDDVLAHVAALRRYALLLAGDASDADDLVQECLLRVIAHTRAWRPVRDLRAYLFTTLHNVFVDGHRRRRTRNTEVPIETVLADLVAPPRQTKWMEVRDMVAALGEISPEQREVVLLVGLEGMSYLEAANVLGIPVGTVMSRLSRGREALRRLTTHGATAKLRVVK